MTIITKDEYIYDFETKKKRYVCTVSYDSYYDEVYRKGFLKDMRELKKRGIE